jgi:hypothetical protein
MTYVPAARRPDGERVFAFLDAHRSAADRELALDVLQRDGLWVNRMIAAMVLANFQQSDSTWWALVRSLRDPHEAVREAAGAVLRALPRRNVDWQSSADDLRLLLGGTNLPAMQSVFEVLASTEVSPSLAPRLLKGNADWVLDHLAMETPMASQAAHRFLVQLNGGVDLGSSRKVWAAWVARL